MKEVVYKSNIYCMFHLYEILEILKLTAKWHMGTFQGERNVLYLNCNDKDGYIHVFAKTHPTGNVKWTYFIKCKLFLNKII